MSLSPTRRSELRAAAHALSPVVIIGDKGLTETVVKEIDRSLKAHELIKVRAATDDRKARTEWMKAICEQLGAEPVQEIGKVLVIYRENPPEDEAPRRRQRPTTSEERLAGARDKQRAKDERKRREREAEEVRLKRSARPRSRTPSPLPESAPPRRRPRTSR
ncbi:MAG TPA: ribosome assembly RNA-binding protein YhbY [Usitatibacter sp.]|nr:ribosome assembly RNA-binding protein YhbY [Usitatibacter sp.]